MAAVVLLGCATINNIFPTETPVPTNTPLPTNTPAPAATLEAIALGERQNVPDGSFSFQPPVGYRVNIDNGLVTINNQEKGISQTIVTGSPNSEDTNETLLLTLVGNFFANPITESLEQGSPYDTTLNGLEAKGMDFSGLANDDPLHGRAVAAVVHDGLFIIAFSIALDDQDPGDRWANEGEALFTAVIDSINFDFEEQQSTACEIADDDSYGYSEDNPIRVGGDAFDGPPRARAFLDNLLGSNGEAVSYERTGSVPTVDTVLDGYAVSIDGGETATLYVDQYSYSEPLAPVGFTCAGAFPLSAP